MLDHSAASITPFLLTLCSFLIVILPMLLIWLPEGATEAPYCPACQAEKDPIGCEHRAPPPRIEQQRRWPHEVDTRNHYCPYFGWVERGHLRSNGHPNGGRWRQLECIVCQRYFMETTDTIFFGKSTPPETVWRALKALAEGLGLRATARVFDVDPNTVERWLRQAAKHMGAVSGYLLHDLQLTQVQEILESAGSTLSWMNSLLFTLMIMFCFALYHYFVWAAMPLDLEWRQMLALSLAALVVVPPTAPLMIGTYQGLLVGTLAVFRVLDVNTLTAYTILVQALQIMFWLIVGIWVLTRTKIRLVDFVRGSREIDQDQL